MKKNMGSADRVIRILLAVVLVLYSITGIPGTLGVVLGILAAVLAITSVIGFCPLYVPFGLSTKKKSST